MKTLVDQAERAGWRIALWALDADTPAEDTAALAPFTVGRGPGMRTALLSRLHDAIHPGAEEHVVIVDDDALPERYELGTLVAVSAAARFGLAQPAHAPNSHYSHATTVRRPWSVARESAFVEIGPIVVVSPEWVRRVLPMPETFGMGWGLEIAWTALADEGCRLGLVDAVPIRHLTPPAESYDAAPERDRASQLLDEIDDPGLFSRAPGPPWRPWRRRPAWTGSTPAERRSTPGPTSEHDG